VGRLKIGAVSLAGLSVAFIVVSFRVGFCFPFLSPLDLRCTSRDENSHEQAAKQCDLHATPPLRVIGASVFESEISLALPSPGTGRSEAGGDERAPRRSAATWAAGASTSGLFGDRTRKIPSWHSHFDLVADLGFDEISRAALMAENFEPAIAVY
jgi:hypothetical protein